jgi:predicted DNA-binding transcriptional regulator AlpA
MNTAATGENPSAPLLWKAREAAKALSVCERTLWDLTNTQKLIPCVRIGRSVRYSPTDLLTWIESQKEEGRN